MTTPDVEGYGPRPGQSDIDRLLEDVRTLSPSGIERIADAWPRVDLHAWHEAERAALHTLESSNRAAVWDELQRRILDLTENHDSMIAWRQEHGEAGHRAEDALLGAALALSARPQLGADQERVLIAPLSAALPWLAE